MDFINKIRIVLADNARRNLGPFTITRDPAFSVQSRGLNVGTYRQTLCLAFWQETWSDPGE